MSTLHMSITQKERQPLERLQQVFGCGSFYFHCKHGHAFTPANRSDRHEANLYRQRKVISL